MNLTNAFYVIAAENYLASVGRVGGFVIFWQGNAVAWSACPSVRSWRPGAVCVCADEASVSIATGGDTDRGATRWEVRP